MAARLPTPGLRYRDNRSARTQAAPVSVGDGAQGDSEREHASTTRTGHSPTWLKQGIWTDGSDVDHTSTAQRLSIPGPPPGPPGTALRPGGNVSSRQSDWRPGPSPSPWGLRGGLGAEGRVSQLGICCGDREHLLRRERALLGNRCRVDMGLTGAQAIRVLNDGCLWVSCGCGRMGQI
jgi:hypothetical protein